LASAGEALRDVGGKILLFASSLPTSGPGTLQPRDNPALYGTPKEHALCAPLNTKVCDLALRLDETCFLK
jgi:protein transport protein SEC24